MSGGHAQSRRRVAMGVTLLIVAALFNLRLLSAHRLTENDGIHWSVAYYDAQFGPVCRLLPQDADVALVLRDTTSHAFERSVMVRYALAPRRVAQVPATDRAHVWRVICDAPGACEALPDDHELVLDLGEGIKLCQLRR